MCASARKAGGGEIAAICVAALLGMALPASALIFIPTVRSASPTLTVCLVADGVEREWKTDARCVADALLEAQVALGENDEILPSLLSPVLDGMTIQVARVTRQEVTLDEKVPYRTVYKPATRQVRKLPTIVTAGRAGVTRRTYEIVSRDGVEVGRRALRAQMVRAPVTQVVAHGRRKPLSSRGYFGGRRVFQMIATAYDPGPLSCGPRCTGRTAIGMKAGRGVVAVDPNVIPLRSRLYIEGYGHAIAGDIGGAIKGHRIDLGYNSRRAALRFGRRKVTVRVLD
jgi:3D (Asp-Asp-Asp) domain-containing protein